MGYRDALIQLCYLLLLGCIGEKVNLVVHREKIKLLNSCFYVTANG